MGDKRAGKRAPRSSRSGPSAKTTARQSAAVERDEESRARDIQWRLGEARALAPLVADKPEVASAPIVGLWPNRRALLIINTKSGPNHDSILHVRDLVEMLAAFGIRADVRVKLRKSQTRKEARAAARGQGYELVIAAGGDGTVEAVASGLVGTNATLGIIPLGTYNNVATCLGIPIDVEQACALIAGGATRRIDVGEVVAQHMKRPRTFLEVSTIGLGAALGPLGQHVEKRRWDQAAQALPGVMDMAPTPTRVRLDNEPGGCIVNTLLVTVSNSPRAGAGLRLAPSAHMDDGLLDVCIYEDMDQPEILAQFLPSPVGHASDVPTNKLQRSRARTVEIHTSRPLPVSIESKLVGVTPARITVLTGALSVICGNASALLQPPSTALVRASASAAQALAPVPPQNTVGDAAQQRLKQPTSGIFQALVPAAGRALDSVSAARPVVVPVLAGVLSVAGASLLPPLIKRLRP